MRLIPLLMLALATCVCGTALLDLHKRIVHGQNGGSHPYMCLLQVKAARRWSRKCSAVIYNPSTLVTAAQCVDRSMDRAVSVDNLRVVCGSQNLDEIDQDGIRNVAEVRKHPDWSHRMYDKPYNPNDVAVVRLETPLNFGTTIQAAMFDRPIVARPGTVAQNCVIPGWGINEDGEFPDMLQEVQMNVISNRMCSNKWQQADFRTKVGDDQICFWNEGSRKGICDGDAGGPAVCDYVVVGIASFGYPRCRRHSAFPNVFTRVSSFYDWITANSWGDDGGDGDGDGGFSAGTTPTIPTTTTTTEAPQISTSIEDIIQDIIDILNPFD